MRNARFCIGATEDGFLVAGLLTDTGELFPVNGLEDLRRLAQDRSENQGPDGDEHTGTHRIEIEP